LASQLCLSDQCLVHILGHVTNLNIRHACILHAPPSSVHHRAGTATYRRLRSNQHFRILTSSRAVRALQPWTGPPANIQ
jgi:hypothetical protein